MKCTTKTEIYQKYFDGNNCIDVRFSDLPQDIQHNDIIEIHREDGFYSEHHSYDAYTKLVVFREREETDKEHQERLLDEQLFKEELKRRRFASYLELRAEFEPNYVESHCNESKSL